MSRPRIVALVTTLAVAWTALWPLVSSAWLLANDEAMPLCHQAGMQVTADMPSPPSEPGSPGSPARSKQHCPLCIMAFLAAFEPPVVAPAPVHLDRDSAPGPYWAALRAAVEVQLPESRAPPLA
jgi:hypothetical protein